MGVGAILDVAAQPSSRPGHSHACESSQHYVKPKSCPTGVPSSAEFLTHRISSNKIVAISSHWEIGPLCFGAVCYTAIDNKYIGFLCVSGNFGEGVSVAFDLGVGDGILEFKLFCFYVFVCF